MGFYATKATRVAKKAPLAPGNLNRLFYLCQSALLPENFAFYKYLNAEEQPARSWPKSLWPKATDAAMPVLR